MVACKYELCMRFYFMSQNTVYNFVQAIRPQAVLQLIIQKHRIRLTKMHD